MLLFLGDNKSTVLGHRAPVGPLSRATKSADGPPLPDRQEGLGSSPARLPNTNRTIPNGSSVNWQMFMCSLHYLRPPLSREDTEQPTAQNQRKKKLRRWFIIIKKPRQKDCVVGFYKIQLYKVILSASATGHVTDDAWLLVYPAPTPTRPDPPSGPCCFRGLCY